MNKFDKVFKSNGDRWRRCVPDSSKEWYAARQLADAEGVIFVDFQSKWAGQAPEPPSRELRVARQVDPQKWSALISELYEPPIIVKDKASRIAWTLLGGEALIESRTAAKHFSWMEAPSECGRIAGFLGTISTRSLPRSAIQQAPTPRIRAKVILRDARRCVMCGRSPHNDPHAHLEAHHGVPWGGGRGGLTVEENLFTLCSTCHRGITGGLEDSLINTLGVAELPSPERERERYVRGVVAYRRALLDLLQRASTEASAPRKKTKGNSAVRLRRSSKRGRTE